MENISSPQGSQGQNTDTHSLNLGETDLLYALNAMIEDRGGNGYFIGNETANELGTLFPAGKQVTGYKVVPELQRVIVFLAPLPTPATPDACGGGSLFNNQGGEIGEIRLLPRREVVPYYTYTKLISSDCLNFQVHYPVISTYKLTSYDFRLYFVDAYNDDRYVYFTFSDRTPNRTLTLSNDFKSGAAFDCNKSKLIPASDRIQLDINAVTTGGSLLSGSYQFWGAYCNERAEELTEYNCRTGMVSIADRIVVSQNGYQTSQAIRLRISADNTVYKYYTLSVISVIEGNTQVQKLGVFPITQTEYLFTGTGSYAPFSLDGLLTKKVYYKHSDGIEIANDQMLRWGLQEKNKPNFQRCFLNLPVYWQTMQLPEGSYKDGEIASKYRSFMRDEVVPLALILEAADGEDFSAIHIPGRVARSTDIAVITNKDSLALSTQDACEGTSSVKAWQVYNTSRVLGTPKQPYDPCTTTTWEYGEMGYWESTELYPADPLTWGEYANTPIRHHKFPDNSVSHIHDGKAAGTAPVKLFGEKVNVYPIGFRITPADVRNALLEGVRNCWITQEDFNQIRSFRIVRGDRTGNASVLAKGLLYDVWSYTKGKKTFQYPNYPFNDLRTDPFITADKSKQSTTTTTTYQYTVYGPANQIFGPFQTQEEAWAVIPPPPDDEQYQIVTSTLGTTTETVNTPAPNITFTPQGNYTFHSPEVHFTSSGEPSILKLETEQFGQSEGLFTEAKGEAKQKILNDISRILIAAAIELSIKEEFISTIFSAVTNTATVDFTPQQYSSSLSVSVPFNSSSLSVSYDESGTGSTVIQTGTDNSTTFTASMNIPVGDSVIQNLLRLASSERSIKYLFQRLNFFELFYNLFEKAAPWLNYCTQFVGVGDYNNFKIIPNTGSKVRAIDTVTMLEPEIQTVISKTGVRTLFNNRDRERSMFISLKSSGLVNNLLLPATTVQDTSRYLLSETLHKELDTRDLKTVSSYYASVKNFLPSQYGTIDSIVYLETGMQSIALTTSAAVSVFGGDTYIGRMSLKRKHRFFIQNRYDLPNGTNVQYEELGNVAYPKYFYNTFEGIMHQDNLDISDAATNIRTLPKYRLDIRNTGGIYDKGYIYLYAYGIPYFLCESAVNLDLRTATEFAEGAYYPQIGDLADWTQEGTVSIRKDNQYNYDVSFSRPLRENLITVTPSYIKNDPLKWYHSNRVIYSETGSEVGRDAWLLYKPLSSYDFGYDQGNLTGLTSLESNRVLARFERGSSLFNAYVTVQLSNDTAQLGNGGMFQNRPQQFSKVDGYYSGSQHKAIIRTEYGTVWVDAASGEVHLMGANGSGMDELSRYGFYHWFKEHLPFRILRQFPSFPIDNAYWGAGLILGYDDRMKRFVLTKRDYRCKDKSITYDARTKQFKKGTTVISINNPLYFEDVSWTTSFNFWVKKWMFHSYIPDYYIPLNMEFWAGKNSRTTEQSSFYVHNRTMSKYQTFFGREYPFMLEMTGKNDGNSYYLWDIFYKLQVRKYTNPQEYRLVEGITYNKAVAYNEYQTTGLLDLSPVNLRDQRDRIRRIIQNPDRTTIKVAPVKDGGWQLNQLEDRARENETSFWDYSPGFHEKWPNPSTIEVVQGLRNRNGALRSAQNKIVFINDKEFEHRFIHLFTKLNQYPSLK